MIQTQRVKCPHCGKLTTMSECEHCNRLFFWNPVFRFLFKDELSSEVYCSSDPIEGALTVLCDTHTCTNCATCNHIQKIGGSR